MLTVTPSKTPKLDWPDCENTPQVLCNFGDSVRLVRMNRTLLTATLLLISESALSAPPPQYWPPQWPGYWQPQQSFYPSPTASEPAVTDGEGAEISPVESSETTEVALPDSETNHQHEKALRAMQEGNYAVAYCIWDPMADAGDAKAQFSIGWMFHNGYGLAIDNRQTLKWWTLAAEQEFANASFALGMLLSHGDNQVEQDLPLAVEHYLQAAHAGHEDAQSMLAHLIQDEARKMKPIIAEWGTKEWLLLGKTIRINVKRANARTQPTLSSRVLTVLEEGTELVQIGKEQRWRQAALPEKGVIVWVHDSLIEKPQSKTGK